MLPHPDEIPGKLTGAAEGLSQAQRAGVCVCASGEGLVYDLRLGNNNSDRFFEAAAEFTDRVLIASRRFTGSSIDDYASYVRVELREADRSPGEYALDLLVLGLSLRRYLGAAENTARWAVALAGELYWYRRESPWSKPLADLGRAALGRFFLAPKIGCKPGPKPYSVERLVCLTDWLQATGEFDQMVRRLNNWRSFLSTLSAEDARRWMLISVDLFDWFEVEAAASLQAYTAGVDEFLSTVHAHRGIREDQIFCGREPVEYHLAMVATEIMNRGLRAHFEQMPKKVVLVPACMRGKSASACRARVFGVDITCVGCDPACTINRITRRMRDLGATVYLVPHSTGFSRWLERWQREPETGVVAAACLLNILSGGYEMRARHIASQCVPLDYPGCQKHWRQERLPTNLNEERLVRIVTSAK
jgi:hypothetical protein